MTIEAGSRLGPYEIVASIGAGGMGEVYRAVDTRLDRTVAVKVLSSRLAGTPELRERFSREARAVSSLSHPHICALYDVGHQDGVDYLVMEYLEGTTLSERLSRGALSLEHVFRYGQQIAEALENAHKQGIVHRDLKPANVMITRTGAKLLDFGLAKARAAVQVSGDGTTRIEHAPLTQEGTLLGTVPYMAPEQLEGNDADARTDIFALGSLLYEMTTGHRAFEGRSTASLIASILNSEPRPISVIQPLTPSALERLIRVCMAKDPDERWQSAHDVGAQLKWISSGGSEDARIAARAPLTRRFAWGAAGVLIGLAAAAGFQWAALQQTDAPRAVARLSINAEPPVNLNWNGPLAIAPDGSRVVFIGRRGSGHQLFVRELAGTTATPIPGTEEGYCAEFSPDGRWLAFGSMGKLFKLSLDGTSRTHVADSGSIFGLRWRGERIYYNRHFAEGIWSVASTGGAPALVARPDAAHGVRALVWPDPLPDGKTILATAWEGSDWDAAKIVMINTLTGSSRVIVDGGSFARYLPSGHLLFGRAGSIFAARFDLQTLQLTSTPIAVVHGVSSGLSRGDAHFAVSSTGTLVFVPGPPVAAARELLWVDRDGKEERVLPTSRAYSVPAPSPNGRMIAVVLESAAFNIWKLDVERGSMTRVSFGGQDNNPGWTPDGNRIVFDSARSGVRNLYWTSSDGSGVEERLTVSREAQFRQGVSPKGDFVLFGQRSPSTGFDVWLLPLRGVRAPRPFLVTSFNEGGAQFSPNGSWVSYLSNESGRGELYVRPFPGPGGKWQVSVDGADSGFFALNGREIFYRSGNKFYVVPVTTEPTFEAGTPRLLFERSYSQFWTVAPNDRLLTSREGPWPVSNRIEIVLNWSSDLERRVPSK